MSKVLFIAIAGHGHVNPTIGIVRELIDRGENVTYIAGEEFREKIEATGAEFKGHKNFNMSDRVARNLSVPNNKSLLDMIGNINLADSKILSNLTNTFKEIIESVFNSNEKFDYIIYDSPFILGPEIGRVLKIPTISSTSTFGINEAIIKNILASLNLDKFKEILNNPDYIDFTKDLQEKYDIKFPSMLSEFTGKGMINIVYTSKYFQPYSETFDESYKFIGPSIIDRKESIDINLKNGENKKIIYISLGTIFNNSIEFYESCLEAFKDINAEIIMSVGKKIDISIFKNIPSNFSVHNYVPQLEVLKHADVFITHGGMNSTNEGLYYDVPLILIPQSVDQPLVANRVAELGAGIVIEKSETTPEMLKKCVERIFSDNSFKINSEKIGKSLREAGGYKRGVDEILNLKKSIKS
jgi:MGT family glycosyltransferase